jgi:hypothetical protein
MCNQKSSNCETLSPCSDLRNEIFVTPHVLLWTKKISKHSKNPERSGSTDMRTDGSLILMFFKYPEPAIFWKNQRTIQHWVQYWISSISAGGGGWGEHYHKPWETERRGEVLNFSRSVERNRHKAEGGRRDRYHCKCDARWFPVLTQFLHTLNCSCGQTRIMPETLSALLSQSGRQRDRFSVA